MDGAFVAARVMAVCLIHTFGARLGQGKDDPE
jgi:hypothetical protein